MAQTESEIISRCQCGDKAAFRWVVERYQRMLFSLALKMLANEEEAKDVVQETFIRIWKGIRNYDPEVFRHLALHNRFPPMPRPSKDNEAYRFST